MARYKRGYQARYNILIKHDLLDWEAEEIAGAYPTFKRTDYTGRDPSVYIRRMCNSRYRTVENLRKYGYDEINIKNFIANRYLDNDWLDTNGDPDPFKMLNFFRQKSIDYGEYFPRAKRHGRSKGRSISRGDVKSQKARAKARKHSGKISLTDYAKGRYKE